MDYYRVRSSYTSTEYNTTRKEYWKCYDSCLLKDNSEIIDEFKQCVSENQSYAKCAKESKQNCTLYNPDPTCSGRSPSEARSDEKHPQSA